MPRPIRASISLSAIRHNLEVARAHAPSAKIWAVTKANAYGHGIERVLPALDAAQGIALLDIDEAVRLRALGYRRPILLLEGFFTPADLDSIDELDLTVCVHCDEQIDMLAHRAGRQRLHVYLKMNSGMNRLGFRPEAYRAAHARLSALPLVADITHMTHLANAEDPADVNRALARFNAPIAGLPGERSVSNSAATLLHPVAHGDWIRPGILLYGASPVADKSAVTWGLEPAMTVSTEIIAVQNLAAGDAIGYGGRFVAQCRMRVGVVACGYADGYPRIAADGTPVIVQGTRVPLVGQVSMDMITVDLSATAVAHVGSPVELWGRQLTVDEVARNAGTVGYELLCALAPRVPVDVVA